MMTTQRQLRICLPVFLYFIILTLTAPVVAQVKINAFPRPRIAKSVNNAQRTTLSGHIPRAIQNAQDLGRLDDDVQLDHMIMVLRRSAEQEHALNQLLDEQQNKDHANYHRWLRPEEFGGHFGVADSDVAQVTDWLTQQGLTVEQVANGKSFILFSGTAKQVSKAFGTEFHRFDFKGESHISAVADPSIPSALAPVISAIPTLHDFFKKPFMIKKGTIASPNAGVSPQWTVGSSTHYFGAGDLAVIYNTVPLLQQGFDGTGVSIGVVGRTNINLSDVQTYRQMFNLKRNDPIFTVAGQDPGVVPGDDGESYLDVEVSGGAAPGAQVNFVVSRSSPLTDGVDLSALYIVLNNLTDIITESYGICEYSLSSNGTSLSSLDFQQALWQQAAAQGITVFVSTGDNGPAACDSANSTYSSSGYAVSGLASTPFNVAVGGTMFSEGTGTYWTTNGPGLKSALSYIPEIPWNEARGSGATGASGLWAGSGGISAYFPRPSWQRGNGIPAADPAYPNGVKSTPTSPFTTGPHRLLPDVSLNAALGHDATVYCAEGVCQLDSSGNVINAGLVGGTSVSAPEMAGLQALVNHVNGERQGMTGYIYYSLANAPSQTNCASSSTPLAIPASSCIFNDITTGNTLVCGNSNCTAGSKLGWTAAAGYDLATGLGSVNAFNLATQWNTVTFTNSVTTLSLSQTTGITHGSNVTFTVQVSPGSGSLVPTGDVAFLTSSGILGDSCTLTNGSCAVSIADLPGGIYNVWARYAGDANFGSSQSLPIEVTVGSENTIVNVASYNSSFTPATTFNYGAFVWIDFEVTNATQKGIATGSLSIYDNGSLLTTAPLNSYGNADLASGPIPSAYSGYLFANIPLFSAGSHVITASYSGDDTFNPATSSPVTITINKVNPTVTARSTRTYITSGASVTFTLTAAGPAGGATPTGNVTFTDSTTSTTLGTAPLVNGIASVTTTAITAANAHSITAAYAGDSNYNSRSATVTVNVRTGTATTVTLTSASNPASLTGRPVLTAAVTPTAATGTVSFWEGSTQLGTGTLSSGRATFTTANTLSAGTHNIVANYQGSTTYAGSSSSPLAQVVNQATPTVQLTVQRTGDHGQNYTFSAVLDGLPTDANGDAYLVPTGTVQFLDGTNPIGSPQTLQVVTGASGGYGIYRATFATTSLTEGSHTITAVFSGDTNYTTAISNAQTLMVRYTPIITWATPSAIVYGTSLSGVQLNPTAASSGNPVAGTFSFTADGLAVSAGAVLSAGHHALVATFMPTDTTNYSLGSTASVDLLVNQAQLTVKADDKTMSYGSALPPLTYAITGFQNSETSAVVSGTPVLSTSATSSSTASSYPITVDVSGLSAANYSFVGVNGTLTIEKVSSSVAVAKTAPAGTPMYGQSVTVQASVTPGVATGTVTFTLDSGSPETVSVSGGAASFTYTSLSVGTHQIVAAYSGDANYNGSTSNTLSITVDSYPAPVAVSQSLAVQYNSAGNAITLSASNNPTSWSYSQPAHGTVTGTAPDVTYTPNPGYAGPDSFSFTATNLGGTSSPATVTINVTIPAGLVTLNPASLSFPPTIVGLGASSKMVTLANGSPVGIVITPTVSGPFAIWSNFCTGTIAPGASCTMFIGYVPQVAGAESGSLSVAYTGGTAPLTVALSGTGVPKIVVTPDTLTFAATDVGTRTGAQRIGVLNRTGAAITITPTITGSFSISTNSCTGTLAPKSGCYIFVNYLASAPGQQTGQLTITPSVGSAETVSLTGTGIGDIQVGPQGLIFAATTVGSATSSQRVGILNRTGVDMTVAAALTGSFHISINTCTGVIAPNSGCYVFVQYRPTAVGEQTGTLTITPSVGTVHSVSLTGTGQ